MSYKQVLEEINKWDNSEKQALLETLLFELRQTSASRSEQLSMENRIATADELYGSIKPVDRSVPDDDEILRIISEERYAKYG